MTRTKVKKLTGQANDFLKIVLPACASGNLNAVKAYLDDERGLVGWVGPHGRTMLWEAARKGRLSVVQWLDEKAGADLRAIGCYYRETRVEVSPWLIAVLNNKWETAEYLERRGAGLDFNSACFLGEEAFIADVLQEKPSVAGRVFVREHRWNGYQVYPLQYAIAGKRSNVVAMLLAAGAKASASPEILFDSIDTRQLDVTEQLLAAGADPRETRHRGWLEWPVFNRLARRYGHSIRQIDVPPEKWPAIVDASRGNHNAPDDPARVRALIDRGHDVNVRDYKGKTALHRASQAGFAKITKLLIRSGANLEAKSELGETPLFDAAFYGRAEQVRLLVAQGADIEARNLNEETPLFAAVRGGQAEVVTMLRTLGVDMDAVNEKGMTVVEVAERSKKRGIDEVRFVLKKRVARRSK